MLLFLFQFLLMCFFVLYERIKRKSKDSFGMKIKFRASCQDKTLFFMEWYLCEMSLLDDYFFSTKKQYCTKT